MKSALVLEKDHLESRKMSQLLSWLGYVTAPVWTPEQALKAANVFKFDLIVTCKAEWADDRRALTGELKRVGQPQP
jgi:CheY-like chemotaxis protein